MKKILSLMLTGMMLMLCAAGTAENVVTAQKVSQGRTFDVTFELPEGAEALSGEWSEGDLYQANIQLREGEYLYMAVDGSGIEAEGEPVTYNEENGYTDEKLLQMIDDLYGDEYSEYDKQVVKTEYGTKIAVLRVHDENAPMAFAWTVWHNFEIGFTMSNVDGNGHYQPITDTQIQDLASFASEVWMQVHENETGEAPAAEAELTPEQQELQTVSEWLGGTAGDASFEKILNWDLETFRTKLEGYEGELKYHTKEEIADTLYQQVVTMKDLMAAMDDTDLSGLVYMIEPIFDGTTWVSGQYAAEIVCQDGQYKVAVAPTLEDIANGANSLSYLCELTDGRALTSIGDGMEGENQADGGKGSTFTVIEEHDVDVLVWKNADGQEVKFSQYNRDYLGRFESGEYCLEITWQDSLYLMKLARGWDAIQNGGADVRSYTARQESMSANLNGIYDEHSEQADKGYCYFCYDEFSQTYEFNNGDELELVFTRAAE